MSEAIEPGGDTPAPDIPAAPDRHPIAGQSILASRAITAPVTVDRTARTVEVVWSTGARARNFIPALGMITEELEMSPNAVRIDALRSGNPPVLNTHRSLDARDVLGRVNGARIERGRGYATLQFSSAADVEAVWQRIADGTLRAVSVGYRVHRYEQRPDAASGETVHRAVDWEPFEISVVPLPVDRDAAVRGELAWAIEHRAEVEIIVAGATPADRTALLDSLLIDVAAAVTADRTLGGAVEWAEPGSPEFQDVESEGAAAARAALLPAFLWFIVAGSPLG